MSNSKLQARIKWLLRDHLSELGFILLRPRMPERRLDGFAQGIEFQPGSGHLAGQYTLNIYWRFTMLQDTPDAFDACQRIGQLLGQGDIWYSRQGDKLDPDFARVKKGVLEYVVPYFERYNTISKIVTAYEEGVLSERDAFGDCVCWRHFNLGCCYSFLGRRDEAVQHLSQVVKEFSDEPFDWVQERRQLALSEIERMSA